jgi:poly(hydroxyalkanoate) granule-associated protein
MATGKNHELAPQSHSEQPSDAIVQSASLYLAARKILVTSLGALALTIDEGNEFLAKLTDRGEAADSELTRFVEEYVRKSNQREQKSAEVRRLTADKAAVALADSVEVILGRLNVPTRTDIEELSKKISALNEKVLTLRQRSLPDGNGASYIAQHDQEPAQLPSPRNHPNP